MNILPTVLKSGLSFFSQINDLINKENIHSGIITNGVGMLEDVELGYFIENGVYQEKLFKGKYEIVSLSGNISKRSDNNETIIHIHVSLADKNYNVIGGHLVNAKVYVGVELNLIKLDNIKLERAYDKNFKLHLLNITKEGR